MFANFEQGLCTQQFFLIAFFVYAKHCGVVLCMWTHSRFNNLRPSVARLCWLLFYNSTVLHSSQGHVEQWLEASAFQVFHVLNIKSMYIILHLRWSKSVQAEN